ncbi:MAG: DUF2231 domain-containing protein [Candidatus Marinimicrobia bacterium]|nr:DUF2231 domain-containing protein [Candidatus Neomarinimicrobiota bacterium]
MMAEIHPLVIHFPIALLSTAMLIDFMFVLSKREDLSQTGWWILLLGLISAASAIATGIWDDTLIGHLGSVFPLWVNHGWIQIFSSIIFLIMFVWRTKNPHLLTTPNLKWIYIGIGSIAVAILFYGGHLGAKLAGRI